MVELTEPDPNQFFKELDTWSAQLKDWEDTFLKSMHPEP
jgi:hypothetical protein